MPRKPKKFAVSWSISVSKEMHERAEKIQMEWHKISVEKLDRKFSMSDLGTIALEIGLEVIESMPKPTMLDTLSKKEISEHILKIEVRKAKRSLRTPKTLSNMTDEQIEEMTKGKLGDNQYGSARRNDE
jgi:hypothetical protein